MSDAIRNAGQNLWLWRTILFHGMNGYFIAVSGAMMATHLLSPNQESFLGCLLVGSKFLEGFMNQGIAQLKQQLSSAFDTRNFLRQETQTPPPKTQ